MYEPQSFNQPIYLNLLIVLSLSSIISSKLIPIKLRFYIFLILKTQRYRLELSKASSSKFRLITSAVGTILLLSPGCNEGKARNETLGIHRQSGLSSLGAALTASGWFVSLRFVNLHSLRKCRPYGAQKSVETINPGLAPWAMQECRPYRALLRFHHQAITLATI